MTMTTRSAAVATTITTTMTMMTTKMSMSTIITTMTMRNAAVVITIMTTTMMMTRMSTSITITMTASADAATTIITTTIMTPTRYSQAGGLRQTAPSRRRNLSPCYRSSHTPRNTARCSVQRECCRMQTEHGTTSILFRKRPRSVQVLRSTQEKCA